MQHGDGVGQIGHHGEVVLHHQHGALCRHLLDQRRDAADVLAPHAGGRLVEQQHFGLQRQRGGQLEGAFAAVGKLPRRHLGVVGEAHRLEQLQACSFRPSGLFRAPEMEGGADLSLQRHAHVLEHGQVREHRRDLERAHHALARQLGRLGRVISRPW